MKKTVFLSTLLISMLVLGTPALGAETNENSQGTIGFNADQTLGQDGLYIKSVDNLDFGNQKITISGQTYQSSNQGDTGFVLGDLTGVYSGWDLEVKQDYVFQTNNPAKNALTNSVLKLKNIAIDQGGAGLTAPSTVAPIITFDTVNTYATVASAQAEEGKGEWSFKMDAELLVPGTALPQKIDYETTLTWKLVSKP